MGSPASPSQRTRLVRHAERGHFDAATLNGILDQALVACLAFSDDEGPTVLPVAFARIGGEVYVHGAAAGRFMQALVGAPVSFCVALTDGIVIARSAFRCSMNYRSVVVFGKGRLVQDAAEKSAALDAMVEKLTLGAEDLRAPSDGELRATSVVAISLTEASAKIRTGPPQDAVADVSRGSWAGEISLAEVPTALVRAPNAGAGERVHPAVAAKLRAHGVVIVETEHEGYLLSTDASRVDVALVHRYLSEQSYWAKGIDKARVERAIAGSIVAGAYLDGQQVGFARVVTDRATFAWLADVFVLPEHGHRGTARGLIQLLLDLDELQNVRRVMLSTLDAHSLYARMGFEPLAEPERYMAMTRAVGSPRTKM